MLLHRRYAMPLAAMLVCWAIPTLAQEPRPGDVRLAGIQAVQSALPEAAAPAVPAPEHGSPPPAAPATEPGNPPPAVPAAEGSDPPPTAPETEQGSPPAAAPATEGSDLPPTAPETEQGSDPPPAASTSPNAGVAGALFVIDDILVEGAKHGSARIVVAETLLTAGQSYSEAQLQQALHRVERLPFVVKAEFALRKGSGRGHFLLVITISETWPVFAGADVTKFKVASAWGTFPEVGARVFLRGYNEFSVAYRGYAGFGRHTSISLDPNIDVSFTRHNLFSKRLAGTGRFLHASTGGDGWDHTFSFNSSSWGGAGKLAFAVTRASVLEVDYTESRSSSQYSYREGSPSSLESGGSHDERHDTRQGTLGWRFDSTDDPFVPRGGTMFTLSVDYSQSEHRSTSPDQGVHIWRGWPMGAGESRESSISAGGARVWPLRWGLSLMGRAGLEASGGHFDGRRLFRLQAVDEVRDGTTHSRGIGGSIEARLLGTVRRRPGSSTHFWWELTAFSYLTRSETEFRAGDFTARRDDQNVDHALWLGLAARGRWGMARLTFKWGYYSLPLSLRQ